MVCPPTVASLGRQSHPSAGRTTTPRLKWFSTNTGSIRVVARRELRQPSATSFADIFSIDGARAIRVMMVDPTRLSIGRSYIAEREDGNKLADVCVRAAKATVLVRIESHHVHGYRGADGRLGSLPAPERKRSQCPDSTHCGHCNRQTATQYLPRAAEPGRNALRPRARLSRRNRAGRMIAISHPCPIARSLSANA